MSNEDKDLEIIRMRKLLELRRKALEKSIKTHKKIENPRDTVYQFLTEDGKEVLEIAQRQYPSLTKYIIEEIYRLIKIGKISEKIDGPTLLYTYSSLGYSIRMPTKIVVKEKGKTKDLSTYFKEKLRSNKEKE